MSKIKVIKKECGKEAELIEIENELEPLKEIVDGYIEVLGFKVNDKGYVLVFDEEGKLKGKEENIALLNGTIISDFIMGDLIVTKIEGAEFGSVDEEDIRTITSQLNNNFIKII